MSPAKRWHGITNCLRENAMPSTRADISAEKIRALLDYDQATGVFRWKVPAGRWGRIPAGTIAGNIGKDGYRLIGVGTSGRTYRAARVAWLWMTGEWPITTVDHRNLDRGDDSWKNLRLATITQQKANSGVYANNTTGLKGVYFDRDQKRATKPWRAKCAVGGKRRWIGRFATREEAYEAYCRAAGVAYGEFANPQRRTG
jgi:HNH endonuclease/AP2 domain